MRALSLLSVAGALLIVGPASAPSSAIDPGAASQPTVVNGDFSAGNIGFVSDYAAPSGGLGDPGTYAVAAGPNSLNSAWPQLVDHTTGSGLMMVVNGSTSPSPRVWSQTISVTPGAKYDFTVWAASLYSSPAKLRFVLNQSALTTLDAPTDIGIWHRLSVPFTVVGLSSATLSIIDDNLDFSGNDFALDDIAVTVAGPAGGTASGTAPPSGVRAAFDYQMDSRFGTDPSGVVSYPNELNPGLLWVYLNACASVGAARYSWTLPPGAVPGGATAGLTTGLTQCGLTVLLPPGQQPVTLTVSDAAGLTGQVTQSVDVRDVLVVSIGDSIASGEGNPDVYGVCDEPTVRVGIQERTPCSLEPVWLNQSPRITGSDNTICHRSIHAAASVAARLLERPHASVTLLHVGCSGGTISQGLMGSQKPKDLHTGFSAKLPPQLEQVNQARNGRPIDALMINVGADDIHFADILQECIKKGVLVNVDKRDLRDCGDPLVQKVLGGKFTSDLDQLSKGLDQLHECVSGSSTKCPSGQYLGVQPDRVFVMGYHDPGRGDDGSFCSDPVLSGDAWRWAENAILGPLNGLLGAKADVFGWTKVADYNSPPYSDSFLTHGLCASKTWVRGFKDDGSKTNQDGQYGSYHIQGDHNGYIHPDQDGHLRMATSLERAMAARLGM